jgi:hypothetical protein
MPSPTLPCEHPARIEFDCDGAQGGMALHLIVPNDFRQIEGKAVRVRRHGSPQGDTAFPSPPTVTVPEWRLMAL